MGGEQQLSRRLIVILVLVLALVGAGGIASYYYYEGTSYVTTEDARVAADLYTVAPEVMGRVVSWNAEVGARVTAGDVLGTLDVTAAAQSAGASVAGNPHLLALLGEKARIVSPASGTVIQSTAKVGQFVSPGQPLATIADLAHPYVSANISETRFRLVKLGAPVTITVDALPGTVLHGRVDQLGQATASTFSLIPAQTTSGSYTKVVQRIPVRIALVGSAPDGLVPGMNAVVRISLRAPVEGGRGNARR